MALERYTLDMVHSVMHHMVQAFLGFDLDMEPRLVDLAAALHFRALYLFKKIVRFHLTWYKITIVFVLVSMIYSVSDMCNCMCTI